MDLWFDEFTPHRERFAKLSRRACRLFACGVLSRAYRELRPYFASTQAAPYLPDLDVMLNELWATDRELPRDRINALCDLLSDMDAGPDPDGEWVRPSGWSMFVSTADEALATVWSDDPGHAAFLAALGSHDALRYVRRIWDHVHPEARRGYSEAQVADAILAELRFQFALLDRIERGENVTRADCE